GVLAGQGAGLDAHRHGSRRLIAEGHTEGDGEQDRKDEDPEERFGFAQELHDPGAGQLPERPGAQAAQRSGGHDALSASPSRVRPARARKRSSSVAWWVARRRATRPRAATRASRGGTARATSRTVRRRVSSTRWTASTPGRASSSALS